MTDEPMPRDRMPDDAAEPVVDAQPERESEAKEPEAQWWESEGMPWKKEPAKADYWCLGWFGFIGIFSLILLPIRAWALGAGADAVAGLAMATGGRTAVASSGAFASQGALAYWPIVLFVASILSLKFDWVYWWAGKLWGRGIIEVWAGQSKRAAKNYARAERWAERLGPLGFLVAYIPIPLPLMQVVFVLSGAANMSLRRFLIYDYIASTLWLVLYFWLGWRFGAAIVDVLEVYARIAMWVALGLIVFIFASSYLAQRRKSKMGS